jgi:tyrosyl-tRNA synthetase
MVGRDLQREEGMAQQIAMVMPILEGLDGKQKMSKSLGNYVALNDSPTEMFGKLMSIGDDLMPRFCEVLLHETMPQGIHPMEAKKSLARRITARFHSAEKAKEALEEFERRFSRKDLEHSELPRFTPAVAGRDLLSVVVQAYETCFGITKSRSDARRLIEGGSVQFGGEKVVDPKVILPAGPGILKLDKTRAVRI